MSISASTLNISYKIYYFLWGEILGVIIDTYVKIKFTIHHCWGGGRARYKQCSADFLTVL